MWLDLAVLAAVVFFIARAFWPRKPVTHQPPDDLDYIQDNHHQKPEEPDDHDPLAEWHQQVDEHNEELLRLAEEQWREENNHN